MRTLIVLAALLATHAFAEDRFAPGNPWFRDFEETCRDDSTMNEECQAGVLGAFAELAGTEGITCDFAKFWAVRDDKFSGDVLAVLPWQNGVEAVVSEPGVCEIQR